MPPSLVKCPAETLAQTAIILAAFSFSGTFVTAQEAIAGSRVRSESSSIRAAISDGHERSPTFRSLVEAVDATDGVVYVQEGQCQRGVRACLHLSVGIAGVYRFLRILVSTRKTPGCALIASIAHELQHALEVLDNPNVKSTSAMYILFDRKAPAGWREVFETDEALEAGMRVEREMCR
jgi:hypothetical protein